VGKSNPFKEEGEGGNFEYICIMKNELKEMTNKQ
jgi:hypothetical protein